MTDALTKNRSFILKRDRNKTGQQSAELQISLANLMPGHEIEIYTVQTTIISPLILVTNNRPFREHLDAVRCLDREIKHYEFMGFEIVESSETPHN